MKVRVLVACLREILITKQKEKKIESGKSCEKDYTVTRFINNFTVKNNFQSIEQTILGKNGKWGGVEWVEVN